MMHESRFDHFDAVMLESTAPLVLLAAAFAYDRWYNRRTIDRLTRFGKDLEAANEAANETTAVASLLAVLVLVLPVVAKRICESFR